MAASVRDDSGSVIGAVGPSIIVTFSIHALLVPQRSIFRTWLQLVRAPNLFTVPGDPLAGYLLAAFGSVDRWIFYPLGASLCFYAGGLLLNDLADLKEDRAERPNRPLPSGSAHPVAVVIAMLLLFLGALTLCAAVGKWTLWTGAALLAAIVAYNGYNKRLPVVGALNMGLCRGLSLLLGATAVTHGELSIPLMLHGRLDHLAAALGLVTLYIAAITHLARYETQAVAPVLAKWLPPLVLASGIAIFLPMVGGMNRPPTIALLVVAFVLSVQATWRIADAAHQALPSAIGQFIRSLLPLQAAFCAASGEMVGSLAAGGLLLLWPISRAVSKQFYAS